MKTIEFLTTSKFEARPFRTTDIARAYCSRTLKRPCDGISYDSGMITPFWIFNDHPHFLKAA